MNTRHVVGISLLACTLAVAATVPAVAASPPAGAAHTAQTPKPVRAPNPAASVNKPKVVPGKTVSGGVNVAVGDVNGDGPPAATGSTARTTAPGGTRPKEFTGPICSETACGCNMGCATGAAKPAQNAGSGGSGGSGRTPNESMSLNFEEIKSTVKAKTPAEAAATSQGSTPTSIK